MHILEYKILNALKGSNKEHPITTNVLMKLIEYDDNVLLTKLLWDLSSRGLIVGYRHTKNNLVIDKWWGISIIPINKVVKCIRNSIRIFSN